MYASRNNKLNEAEYLETSTAVVASEEKIVNGANSGAVFSFIRIVVSPIDGIQALLHTSAKPHVLSARVHQVHVDKGT